VAGGGAATAPVGHGSGCAPDGPAVAAGPGLWCQLQAAYWEHQAQAWQARARTAEAATVPLARVAAVAREALQTLVRRVVDALDASGAPNPSVPEVCREILKDIEAVPWDALVDEMECARACQAWGGGGR
jgi:hypothetical protein